jgi:hypothetical protein
MQMFIYGFGLVTVLAGAALTYFIPMLAVPGLMLACGGLMSLFGLVVHAWGGR